MVRGPFGLYSFHSPHLLSPGRVTNVGRETAQSLGRLVFAVPWWEVKSL